jgi:DnaK suppressor protein
MNEAQLLAFKTSLLQRRDKLLEAVQSGADGSETVELDQTRQGRLSRMDALQGQAMSIAAKNRRNQEMANIERALQRIDEGSYGVCQRCDNEIPVRRLEFDMTVLYCIDCAEQLES